MHIWIWIYYIYLHIRGYLQIIWFYFSLEAHPIIFEYIREYIENVYMTRESLEISSESYYQDYNWCQRRDGRVYNAFDNDNLIPSSMIRFIFFMTSRSWFYRPLYKVSAKIQSKKINIIYKLNLKREHFSRILHEEIECNAFLIRK